MRVLVVFAHPVETSFQASLHRTTVAALAAVGHEVDDCDLYAEGFNPVLSRQERIDYHNLTVPRDAVEPYIERLRAAEGLVLNFPVWNFGYPAILKGFFDRVFLPGVSFKMEGGRPRGNLHNVRKLGAVVTYGGTRFKAMLAGDPPRRSVKRAVRSALHPLATTHYLAFYDMNNASEDARRTFEGDVKAKMARF